MQNACHGQGRSVNLNLQVGYSVGQLQEALDLGELLLRPAAAAYSRP
jgi:hypothetical protein